MVVSTLEGVVLKTTRAKEQDYILQVMTRTHGKVTLFGRLGQKFQSSNSSSFQVGNLVKFTLFEKQENTDLPIITQCFNINLFPRTKTDFTKMLLSQYVIEVIMKNTEDRHINTGLYDLLVRSLSFIETNPISLNWKTTFEYFTLQRLGMQPRTNECVLTGVPLTSGIFNVDLGGLTDYALKNEGYRVSNEDWLYFEHLRLVKPYSEEYEVPAKVAKIISHMLSYYGNGPFKALDYYLKPLEV